MQNPEWLWKLIEDVTILAGFWFTFSRNRKKAKEDAEVKKAQELIALEKKEEEKKKLDDARHKENSDRLKEVAGRLAKQARLIEMNEPHTHTESKGETLTEEGLRYLGADRRH